MPEPTYRSTLEFADAYGIERRELSRLIGLGVIKPRRERGNSVLSETDMMKIVRYNTARRNGRAV